MINIAELKTNKHYGTKNRIIKGISMFIDDDLYSWLKEQNINKTRLFVEAAKEIGYVENKISTIIETKTEEEKIILPAPEKIITPEAMEEELFNADNK
jgi:hypothetical protein